MNICVFGDSITWGACDYKYGGWATRLRNYFEERGDTVLGADEKAVDVEVCNLGISGDNTDDLLKRVELEAIAREPEMIIFAIGINDSQYLGGDKNKLRVSFNNFIFNLNELVRVARKFTNKIVFVGLTDVDESKTKPIPWSPAKSYDNALIAKYDSAIKDFCKEKN